MSGAATIFLNDERGGVFGFGPLVLIDWRHNSSTAPVDAADLAVEAAARFAGPGRRVAYVHRVSEKSQIGRATPDVRTAALQHFERHDAKVFAAAIALEATGFGASVIRSATAGVLLLRPTPIQTRVFKDAGEGVRWLRSFDAGKDLDVDGALDAFAALGVVSLTTAHPMPA